MAILLAILAAAAALANFSYWRNTPLQFVATATTLLAVLLYTGRRTRASYNGDGTRLFTLDFTICLMALVGIAAVLAAFLLHL